MADRTVVIRNDTGEEFARIVWDGEKVTVSGTSIVLLRELESVGRDYLTPADGEAYLDDVLEEYGRGSMVWAEELPA